MKNNILFWVIFSIICVLTPQIPIVHASGLCYNATGFDITSANGLYTDTGTTENTHPVYTNGTSFMWADGSSGIEWVISITAVNTDNRYYADGSPSVMPQFTSWIAYNGASYGGNTTITDCGGLPPDDTFSTNRVFPGFGASTTFMIVDNPNQDVANAFFLFIGGIMIMILLFNRKK